MSGYVHGYRPRENERLGDQAGTLVELLHADTTYPAGARVLEPGCGVGTQTITLARRNPEAAFTAIDVAADSVTEARQRAYAAGVNNVAFAQADVTDLPFAPGSFDHVFVCFLLEHLPAPEQTLAALGALLRPGGTMTVLEGDHGSAYFHPDSQAAREVIGCQIELQARAGGDAMIGRRIYPLLVEAGLGQVWVSPRMVYVDASRPELVDGVHPQDLHRDDRRRPRTCAHRRTHRSGPLRPRRAGTAPHHRTRRRVLLYLLQRHRAQAYGRILSLSHPK